jgi:hypothetical protein
MLTVAVNIAVFAAFQPRIGGILLSNPEFKPSGVDWRRDMWGSGWQKRQDWGKKWQWMARWAAKAARVRRVVVVSRRPPSGPRLDAIGRLAIYLIVKVLAARGGATIVELNYHKSGGMSRRKLIA